MSYDFGVTETDPDVTDAFSHATIQHDNTMYMCMYMFAPYSHRFTPVHTCECAKKSGLDSRKGRGPWLWPLRRVSFSYAIFSQHYTYTIYMLHAHVHVNVHVHVHVNVHVFSSNLNPGQDTQTRRHIRSCPRHTYRDRLFDICLFFRRKYIDDISRYLPGLGDVMTVTQPYARSHHVGGGCSWGKNRF